MYKTRKGKMDFRICNTAAYTQVKKLFFPIKEEEVIYFLMTEKRKILLYTTFFISTFPKLCSMEHCWEKCYYYTTKEKKEIKGKGRRGRERERNEKRKGKEHVRISFWENYNEK